MTPKEKAEELIWRYNFTPCMTELQVKQCALIAVDEIIKTLIYNKVLVFWQEVKQEIQKF